MTATPNGDAPINLLEFQFTVAEVARVAGVPSKTIRSWMERDLFIGGEKHFTGRWMFSGFDILRLIIMGTLATFSIDPSKSKLIAALVMDRCLKATERDPVTGKLIRESKGYRPNLNFLVAYDEDGNPFAYEKHIDEPGKFYPPTLKEVESEGGARFRLLRRPHIVIPVDAIMGDLVISLGEILDVERGND